MDAFIVDWLALIMRWFHVIAGIAWIGASFYFIWLDRHLETPPDWKAERGIRGDLWAIHGGGIYEVAKYHTRPEVMPERLHWFKWEAYTTWLTGMGLAVLVYYFHAAGYLVGPESPLPGPYAGIAASLALVIAGPAAYEAALKSPLVKDGRAFAGFVAALVLAACVLATWLFTPRAAFVHVGMFIGSIMAGNVFLGIIPSQKAFLRSVEAGETPDPSGMVQAKLRSTHNNYLTLPVVFSMLSNHFPQVYGHPRSWLVLAAILATGAYVRHFFMLKHVGIVRPHILATSAVAMAAIAIAIAPPAPSSAPADHLADLPAGGSLDAVGMAIVETHCTGCHAAAPTFAGLSAPPLGLILETPADVAAHADKVHANAVAGNAMPLGNLTGMRDEERVLLGAWLAELGARTAAAR